LCHASHPVAVDLDVEIREPGGVSPHTVPSLRHRLLADLTSNGNDEPVERPAAPRLYFVRQHVPGHGLTDAVLQPCDRCWVVVQGQIVLTACWIAPP